MERVQWLCPGEAAYIDHIGLSGICPRMPSWPYQLTWAFFCCSRGPWGAQFLWNDLTNQSVQLFPGFCHRFREFNQMRGFLGFFQCHLAELGHCQLSLHLYTKQTYFLEDPFPLLKVPQNTSWHMCLLHLCLLGLVMPGLTSFDKPKCQYIKVNVLHLSHSIHHMS